MKKKLLLLIICICSINVFAQKECKISIVCDTTIFLHDIKELANDTIYGDRAFGGSKDEYFKKNQVDPNGISSSWVNINRQNDSKGVRAICLKINYSSLPEAHNTLKFKKAFEANKGDWYPDPNNIIVLKIEKNKVETSISEGVSIPEDSNIENSEVEDTSNVITTMDYVLLLILGAVIIVLLLAWRNIIDLKKNCCNLHESLKKFEEFQIKQNQKNSEIQQLVSDYHIENIVVQKIKTIKDKKVEIPIQKEQNIFATNVTTKDASETRTKVVSKTSLDTENVVYNEIDNSFSIVKECDVQLFRIYSEGDQFYYTIIDDNQTREELLNMLNGFTNCINVVDSGNSKYSRVEPYQPGLLFKNGESYIVDTNNKLQIRLV